MNAEEILDKMDELRKRLNREIERCNYDLNAPSVLRLSAMLDECIVHYYHMCQKRPLTNAR
ncbi:MAG: aspartyl-phosphate phosphatase Spo0E family protein [Clostridiales bacterium]|jgi:hypothetical protein|nr:aspartyl-phosphate phosphatase Spo0E family protein [Clostridiales bacterium]